MTRHIRHITNQSELAVLPQINNTFINMASSLCGNVYWLISAWCISMIRHGSPTSSSASRLGSRHRHRKRLRCLARRAAALDGEVSRFWIPQGGDDVFCHDPFIHIILNSWYCGAEKKEKTNFQRSRRLTARINQLEAFQAPLRQWLVKDEETLRGWYRGGRWVYVQCSFLDVFLSFGVLVCVAKHASCQGFPVSKDRN